MRSLLERFNSHDGLLINIVISLCVYIQSMYSVSNLDSTTTNAVVLPVSDAKCAQTVIDAGYINLTITWLLQYQRNGELMGNCLRLLRRLIDRVVCASCLFCSLVLGPYE